MDRVYEALASNALSLLSSTGKNRIIIAIVGIPGSGKTTIAERVSHLINKQIGKEVAKAVGMDGYHLTRQELSAMDDPVTAHERRGAPFTFNANGVVQLVKDLRDSGERGVDMTAPSFDHKIKDPVQNGIFIGRQIQIVLVEGLYLLLKDDPWGEISGLVDSKWHVVVEQEIARVRVANRHLLAGITDTLELAFKRADGNDAVNGKYIMENSVKADMEIYSMNDDNEVPGGSNNVEKKEL